MMTKKYSYKTRRIQKIRHQATNSDFLEVEIEIFYKGKVATTRSLAFPVSITKKKLLGELEKLIETYAADAKISEEQKEVEKETKKISDLRTDMMKDEIEVETIADK